WKLVDASAADPLTAPALACADAHVASVRLGAHNSDTGEDFFWVFPCDPETAVSPDVTVGTYTITVDALDAAGTSKSHDSWQVYNVSGTDLGLVIFALNP